MTPPEQQTMAAGEIYSEDRSPVQWPYAALLACWALLFALGAAWMTTWANPAAALMMAIAILGLCPTAALAVMVWPVGIRIDGDGIRIGGVRRTRRPDRTPPWADSQRGEILRVPWQAVRRAAVDTDRPGIRDRTRDSRPVQKGHYRHRQVVAGHRTQFQSQTRPRSSSVRARRY